MRLTRVHVPGPLAAGCPGVIAGAAANHVRRVLRLREGDELVLFDGRGGEYPARIIAFRKDAVQVSVGELRPVERESPLAITLLQAIARGDRMDVIAQKATELGVQRIVPVLSEHTVVRLDEAGGVRRREHWQGIAVAACEQCGRNRVPQIDDPVPLHEALALRAQQELGLMLDPDGGRGVPDGVGAATRIAVLIGPEGGLSRAERELAVAQGFEARRFGPRILRTETAAIAALAALQCAAGDMAG